MSAYALSEPSDIRASQSATSLDTDLEDYVNRHLAGDWEDVTSEVETANELAVRTGDGSIGSACKTLAGWLFVITSGERSATTTLVPTGAGSHLQKDDRIFAMNW